MARRAYQTNLSPRFYVYRERQKLSGVTERHTVIHSKYYEGGRVHPTFRGTSRSRTFFQLQPTVILSGTNTGQHSRGGEKAYSQYIRHLEKTSPGVQAMQKQGSVENFAIGYQDYLQAPLQVCDRCLRVVRGL